jgi:hypothetical protein
MLVSPAAAPADQPRWWGPNQRRPAAPSIRICRHPVDLWTARRGAAHNPTGSTTEKEAYIGFCATHSKVKRGIISRFCEECVDEVMSFLEENQARLAELAGRAG